MPFEDHYIPEPMSGCWLWLAHVANTTGYGQTTYRQRTHLAHRVSWILHRGEIPDGAWVLHKCDQRSCVNPDHLYLGTAKENSRDRDQKGRGKMPLFGENHHHAKLTKENIRAIRSDMRPQRTIAQDYGIGQQAVSHIQRRVNWKHVP